MTVVARYIVVRNGVELDEVFSVKKEADAYDKMLDAADNLAKLIKESGGEFNVDEKTIDDIAVLLAKNGPQVTTILRGIKPVVSPAETVRTDGSKTPASAKATRGKMVKPAKGKKK